MVKTKRGFYKQWLQFFKLCRKPRFWLFIILFLAAFLVTIGPLKVLFDQDFLLQHLQAHRAIPKKTPLI